MKLQAQFASLGLVAVLVLAGCHFSFTMSDGFTFDYRGEQASKTDSGAISDNVARIQIENRFGTVHVEAAQQGDTMWSWDLTCWADTEEEANAFAEQIEMQWDEAGDSANWSLVLPAPPQRSLRGVRSNLTLRVPPEVMVDVKNRGDVAVDGLAGEVNVENAHGDIALRNLTSACTASNEHGELAAANLANARLSSRHGTLTAEGVTGNLEVSSEHGGVEVTDVAGQLRVKNRHGRIVARHVDGDVDLDCEHNNIDLDDANGDVRLSNRHGRIQAEHVRGRIEAENHHGRIDLRVDSTDVKCKGTHSQINLELSNPSLQAVNAATSHASIDVSLALDDATPVVADVEHGNVRSDFPVDHRTDTSAFVFKTRHGNLRIEKSRNP